MVDVSGKPVALRMARAQAVVRMRRSTFRAIRDGKVSKGNVLETARLAGIQAAKRAWEFIPLCHPLSLSHVQVGLCLSPPRELVIECAVKARERTGVEIEALAAAAVAALTVYDMCKSVDRGMTIRSIELLEKSGGKSGHFLRPSRRNQR